MIHINGASVSSQIFLNPLLLSSNSSNSINPSRQPHTRTRNLQLHNIHSTFVVLSTKIIVLDPIKTRRKHILTNQLVGLRRPLNTTLVWVREVSALSRHIRRRRMGSLGPFGKRFRPLGCCGLLLGCSGIEAETVELARDGRVPDAVQVGALGAVPVEGDGDVVSATAEILGVQRLVDVADKVQDKFQGFVTGPECGVWVQDDGSLLYLWSAFDVSLGSLKDKHTWLERAETTQPCICLQSRAKSRLQFSGGLSFASVQS